MDKSKLIEWVEKQTEEEEGNWETKDYHQGYKDAMNDLKRHLSNLSFDRIIPGRSPAAERKEC